MSVSARMQFSISERTLFLGPKIPTAVKLMSEHVSSLQKSVFRALVHLAVNDLEGKQINDGALQKIEAGAGQNAIPHLNEIYAGIYAILKLALQIPQGPLKLETFKEDLKELKIPEVFITDLSNVLYGQKRSILEKCTLENCPHLPHLENLRWRVDVTISSGVLSRVLEPTVLLEATLSTGKIQIFEVPISKFHQLRYSVASVLKEMEDLEKRSIFKMQT